MLGQIQMQCCGSRGLFKLPSTLHPFPSTREKACQKRNKVKVGRSPWNGQKRTEKVVDVIQVIKDESTNSNVKRALLVARKKERINLPLYENANVGEMYHISQFLKHPTGVEAMLNLNALESYVSIDTNTYRCKLPPIQLLKFEVAPVLDLEVSPASEFCTVELLSCKFEGSELVENQNKNFSATMQNLITWDDNDSESFLDVDVKLNITLEIHKRPFILLPVSTVEGPGNLVLQALLDRFVPLLLQQLLQDYDAWIKQQPMTLP